MTSDLPSKRGRGRRRAPEVRSEVLAATGKLLFGEGMQAVTFERIAREAGASKTTLYKWWPSPGALAAEAFFEQSAPSLEFPDTGDLHSDLVTQITAFAALLSDENTGRPISELVGAAQLDPALAEAWTRNYAHPRRDLALARLRSAQRAGQLRMDTDLDIIVDQLWGAFYHRFLILRTPLKDLNIERLVTYALRAAS